MSSDEPQMQTELAGEYSTARLTPRPMRQPLTLEMALWILVGAFAFVLRLANLEAAPLNGAEARRALLAWRAVAGQGVPTAGYSPFLLTMGASLFALFGASDSLARLGPALCGGTLALVPVLFRQRIGRAGALAAGVYLALSPTVLVASRQLDGAVVAALGGMLFLGGLIRFRETDGRAWLTLTAIGVALAVTSSPSAYGLYVSMGLSWVLLAWGWQDGGIGRLGRLLRPHLGHVLLVFVLAVLAISTGLGWNPTGLGAVGGLLPAWIARFGQAAAPAASPLALLAIYEPLAVLFGLGGLVWAVRRQDRQGVLLGVWACLGALLAAVMPSRSPLDLLWPLLPLVLLGGMAAEALVQGLRLHGEWHSEGLYVPVVVTLWIHLYLMLARYAVSGTAADLALASLTVVLQVLLATIFALAMRVGGTLRALSVGTGIALLAVTLATGWGSAHVRPADPRELLVTEPTAFGARDLVRTLRDLSWDETGLPATLSFTIETSPDSVLAWYLREFSAARVVDVLDQQAEPGGVFVTTRQDQGDLTHGLNLAGAVDAAEFKGQDFVLRRRWDPREVMCAWEWPPRCHAAIRWLLFRESPSVPEPDHWAVLWQQQDGEAGGE